MNILITGGAGFIGSHLTRRLLKKGHKVTVIDDMSTGSIQNLPSDEHDNLNVYEFSVAEEYSALDYIIFSDEIDLVYHLAASVGVQNVWDDPIRCITNNIQGTLNVLRACRANNKRLLITSTSEVYGYSDSDYQGEGDHPIYGHPINGRWGYAASKYIDELMAFDFHKRYGLEVTVVRLFNTIGERQTGKYGMVVPRFIKQAKENLPLTVYGDGKQIRTFTDVNDVVWALAKLLKKKDSIGQLYNIGSSNTVAILYLAQSIIRLTGSKSKIKYIPYYEAFDSSFVDMERRVPDITKIKEAIGFKPNNDLEEILLRIINA